MSDLSIELEPTRAKTRAVTKSPLVDDMTGIGKHGHNRNAASRVEALLTEDEIVLAGFGKKQQLKVKH